jgi:tRNA (guanine37-N1)-methyltransferase
MVLIDAMVRLLPGVLGDGQSAVEDSFSPECDGLLDHPHYTRPETWNGEGVPVILMSGDHGKIEEWRRKQALKRSQERRPDLLDGRNWNKQDLKLLDEIRQEQTAANK